MKKTIKKLAVITSLCACLSAGLISTPTKAATWKSKTINNANGFNKAWEKTVTYRLKSNNSKIGTMTYGYNTFLTKEDYVWTKSNEGYTLAEVKRISIDNEVKYGNKAGMNKYSKIEVKHQNFHIKYQIKFYATYGDTFESEATSSVK